MARLTDLLIGVSGNIGAGKTTLTSAAVDSEFRDILLSVLDENPNAIRKITSLKEDVDESIRKQFYEDPSRFALAAQLFYFNARLKREKTANLTPGIVLMDRPIEEDYHIFGKAQRILENMTEVEFSVYEENYRQLMDRVSQPDVYIYLKADLETLTRNIERRAISDEQGLVTDTTYLQTLQSLYDEFFRYHVKCPVMEIDANRFKLDSEGKLDKKYIKNSLTMVANKIKTLSFPKLTKGLGKWLSYNPTEAVVKSIEIADQLKQYLRDNKTLMTMAGNIGLGKTAWARIISYDLGIKGSYELDPQHDLINDNLLSKFLGDKKRYCYDLQKHFLGKRLELRIFNQQEGKSVIEDRTPEEDPAVFHKLFLRQGLLSESEYDHLQCDSRMEFRKAPSSDLMILLQARPELSYSRILGRRRSEEVEGGWELERDLRPLAGLYSEFASVVSGYGLHKGPVLVFDSDSIDITNRAHQGFIYENILNALKGVER